MQCSQSIPRPPTFTANATLAMSCCSFVSWNIPLNSDSSTACVISSKQLPTTWTQRKTHAIVGFCNTQLSGFAICNFVSDLLENLHSTQVDYFFVVPQGVQTTPRNIWWPARHPQG
mmetsp:Transcript_11453/g.20658  ORF Transcript_11453/g.20658 Transcript_11453/m.20658 type:complete len:116 (-) Transcript_11453:1350-1697(-)